MFLTKTNIFPQKIIHMKTLIIVRHAKSDWSNSSDIDRPLNERGRNDAPRIGLFLKEKGIQPDLLLSSTANRALSTARLIAEQLNYPVQQIETDDRLYAFTSDIEELYPIIQGVDARINTLMIFGHNPTFTYLANALTQNRFDEIPTCAALCFSLGSDNWQSFPTAPADLRFFIFPKMLK